MDPVDELAKFEVCSFTRSWDNSAIGSARQPAPSTLFHARGRTLATELFMRPGQSCGTVCQRQFVTGTVYTLL